MGGLSKAQPCFELSGRDKDSSPLQATIPTNLYLPSKEGNGRERLFLPDEDVPIDEYLSKIPHVASRAHDIHRKENIMESDEHAQPGHGSVDSTFLRKASTGRCLNVLQGEVAHASTDQTDFLVSAEATTCHVIALRSTKSENVPLVSLAHVDQAGVYNHCLDTMVQEHVKHHTDSRVGALNAIDPDNEDSDDDEFFFFESDEEVSPEPTSEASDEKEHSFLPSTDLHKPAGMPVLHKEPKIEMELHMVGGYDDKKGLSRELSSSLLTAFSHLADKYQDTLSISLSTAAISCMNTEGEAPKSRGLGIDTHTGEVFPITSSLPKHLEGPGLEVRSARAFARLTQKQSAPESLHCIHDRESQGLKIEPFQYEPIPAMNALLKVPDKVLLKYTSTSPECESDRFCSDLRRTVSFVNSVDSRQVFGDDCQRPLVYTRSSNNLNEWQQVATT